jgi:prepilin-type processing-associated H-X9-DG protein
VDDFQKYPIYEDVSAYPVVGFWQDKVLSYAANSKAVFICPANFNSNVLNNWSFLDQEGYHGPNRSYGYNASGSIPFFDNRAGVSFPLLGLDGDPFSSPEVRPLPEALVVAPADMIALADYDPVTSPIIPDPDNDGDIYGYPAPAYSLWEALRGRHSGGGGANVVFCDAHVEYAKTNRWTAMTDSALRRWNHDHVAHP